MIVCRSIGLVFVEIPRTASVPTANFLLKHLGGKRLPGENVHECELPAECIGYRVMCGIRNPYTRILSAYLRDRQQKHARARRARNYTQYVRRYGRSCHDYLRIAGVSVPELLVRFEGFPASLYGVLSRIMWHGTGKVGPARQPPTTRNWRQAYTAATAEAVWRVAQEDFEVFGYGRNSWRR